MFREAKSARAAWLVGAALAFGSCATAPPPVLAPAAPSYEQQLTAILHLEDRRLLSDPGLAPLPSDIVALLGDAQGRVRRRAALGVGRAGLVAGVAPLSTLLASDAEPEVRAMAAFALGLIGDSSAAPVLVTALGDADPRVQGRAAEALGSIGHDAAAQTIAGMAAVHVRAGALGAVASHDESYPLSPPVEAIRLGVYALARLKAVEPLRAVVLGADGAPVSDWWPLAHAMQRVEHPSTAPALRTWLRRGGATTRAFAVRGLGAIKDAESRVMLEALAKDERQTVGVRVQSVRALGAMADRRSAAVLVGLLAESTPPNLRVEAMTALGSCGDAANTELLLDYVEHPWLPLRVAAQGALAKTDLETFMTVMSGLDPDAQWQARAALATTLGGIEASLATPRLAQLADDADPKVRASALAAMVRLALPGTGPRLIAALSEPDPALRMSAASGLAVLKTTPGAVEALRRAFDASRADTTYIARAALLAALAAIDASGAAPMLKDALRVADWAVRVRAAALMKDAGITGDAVALRPAPVAPPSASELAAAVAAPQFSPQAYVQTSKGEIRIELSVLDAPRTVASFIGLVRRGFFSGLTWHRVVPDFVVQAGDPRGDGEGGPGYTIRDELNDRPYLRGTVGMALDWRDTGGSQFFITQSPQPHLDGRYTVFGRVVAGMDVVERLEPRDTINRVRVWDGAEWIGETAK